jgi:probable rRNA maturation factor
LATEHEISSSSEVDAPVDMALLERTAAIVLEAELDEPAEMSFVLVGDAAIRELNRNWRGYDEPTDVLSFGLSERSKPAVDDEEPFPFPRDPEDVLHLGEVVISYPTAERQAVEHARPLEEELRHLLIHGILHLLGYDHAEAEEEIAMRAREVALLAASAP